MMHEILTMVMLTAAVWLAIFSAVVAMPRERPHQRKHLPTIFAVRFLGQPTRSNEPGLNVAAHS
jgi:hypothetical protein